MTENQDSIYFFAFRYVLGRKTYAPSIVREELIKVWDDLQQNTRQLIIKEIKESIDKNQIGMKMDQQLWEEFLEEVDDQ